MVPGGSPKISPCHLPGRDGGKHPVLSGQSPGPPFLADTPRPCTVPSTGRPVLQPAARPAGPLSWGPSSHPHAPSPPGFILTLPVPPEPAASGCPVALSAQAPGRELPQDGARPLHLLPATGPGTPRLPPTQAPWCPGSLSVKDTVKTLDRARTFMPRSPFCFQPPTPTLLREPRTHPRTSRQARLRAFRK